MVGPNCQKELIWLTMNGTNHKIQRISHNEPFVTSDSISLSNKVPDIFVRETSIIIVVNCGGFPV